MRNIYADLNVEITCAQIEHNRPIGAPNASVSSFYFRAYYISSSTVACSSRIELFVWLFLITLIFFCNVARGDAVRLLWVRALQCSLYCGLFIFAFSKRCRVANQPTISWVLSERCCGLEIKWYFTRRVTFLQPDGWCGMP